MATSHLDEEKNPQRDDLRLLSAFHWVLAGLAAIFSLLPLIYVVMGGLMVAGSFGGRQAQTQAPPLFIGWVFIAMGAMLIIMGFGYAVFVAIAGRCIARRRHWTLVIVVAGLSCAFFPFGTVLGVFTIVVLSKPEVKALFQALPTAPPHPT